jgi:hypothetical protein
MLTNQLSRRREDRGLRTGRASLNFIRAAAHFHDSKSTNLTRITASNLKAIEEVNVTGIEKSDY